MFLPVGKITAREFLFLGHVANGIILQSCRVEDRSDFSLLAVLDHPAIAEAGCCGQHRRRRGDDEGGFG